MKQMKLLTEEIKAKLPPLYSQENEDSPDVVCKFFTPDSHWTWYVTEGEEKPDGDWLLFGLVDGHEKELGYFLLSELEATRGPLGLPIERDMYFGPTTLAEVY